MKTAQEILVECWYDKTDIESITQWADTFVKNNDHIPEEVFEIFYAPKYHFEDILFRLSIAVEPDFSPQSLSADILAAKYLINSIKKYLSDEMTPIDICRVIRKIDCGFMNAPRDLLNNVAYYPYWLGNLYSGCDWCDETWTNSNAPHLKQDLENQLPHISEWINSNS
ncbi:hypothetical protein ACTXGK_05835 [Psychrobacter sp. T6-5]|uniref:hypothetical protein n=1 Tax=Psychrobacter sp. T6-5 TaxID=3457451 RepID=UPI003FD37AFF